MSRLPSAPLQEVIFEVHWDLSTEDSSDKKIDLGLELAVGALRNLVKNKFPVFKKKHPDWFPADLLAHNAHYQFWTEERKWPVLQLGPGIFTINDTDENYDWDGSFLPIAKDSLANLYLAYENKLAPTKLQLRYIDSVDVENHNFVNWIDFFNKNFNINFSNQFNPQGKIHDFRLEQTFKLEDNNLLKLVFTNGKSTNRNMFIWESSVYSKQSFNKDEILPWLENAHKCTSQLFRDILTPDFYASFTKS